MSNIYLSLCRFCLHGQGVIPLFDDKVSNGISANILLCFHEKIEDIEGYPKSICNDCNLALDSMSNFLTRYKESNKILENYFLSIVKYEPHELNSDDGGFSEPEIELNDLKIEYDDCDDKTLDFLAKVKNKLTVTITRKRPVKKRKNPSKTVNVKTNPVATSILEGVFNWTGEKWCQSTRLKVEPSPDKPKGRQPKLNISKIKKKQLKEPAPSKLCDLCGEVFKSANKLRLHRNKIHKAKQNVPCTFKECKGIFTNIYNLKRHMQRAHSNKEFQCNDCGRFFALKHEMKNHMKIHDRIKYPKKMYNCQYCNKTYKCQKSVDIHERSVHTGLRPAVCSVCSAAFFHEEYLKQHMYLHTGETPFSCPVCGRGYAQRGNMKSHLRIHRMSEIPDDILKKLKPAYLKLLKY